MTYQKPNGTPTLLNPVQLSEKVERLCQILEFENELLELDNPAAMSDHQAEKSRLVAIYNQQMTLIKADPERYKRFPKADVDRLKATSEIFYEALDLHFRKLSTIKTVTEGLVKAVADEVAKKKGPPATYNAAASMTNSVPTQNSRTLGGAIAYNEVV
ncbi:hypothetical protein [Sneathiella aquimaris]|uniref:hypothetical protein n=1 Tax=Sneathiella aquimaris TaxID=2599305 RepID=UPI00146E9F07|nr:hypothetical protein [Sneathiella aquimaris]